MLHRGRQVWVLACIQSRPAAVPSLTLPALEALYDGTEKHHGALSVQARFWLDLEPAFNAELQGNRYNRPIHMYTMCMLRHLQQPLTCTVRVGADEYISHIGRVHARSNAVAVTRGLP